MAKCVSKAWSLSLSLTDLFRTKWRGAASWELDVARNMHVMSFHAKPEKERNRCTSKQVISIYSLSGSNKLNSASVFI